ncbi:MAG: NUDIX domain-containing protein [Mariprofundus sp.]|nr:NUDIX domain-containing protein [Mariprofundus sp.]
MALVAPFDCKGNLLLLKRNQNQHCGGLWSFSGGKVEAGESAKEAAIRELKEETGLSGTDWHLLGNHDFEYPDCLLHFHLFSCLCEDISPLACESPHAWVKRSRLSNYPMPDANQALIPLLNTDGLAR